MALRKLGRALQILETHSILRHLRRGYYLYTPEPIHPLPDKTPDWKTADEALQVVQSGQRIFVHGAAATPCHLIEAMCRHGTRADIRGCEVMHIHTEGPGLYNEPEYDHMFRSNSLFVGGNSRKAIHEGRADAIPIFLSEIPRLFRHKIIHLDIALVTVSPPDKHGFCSLGTSVDCTRSAVQNAKYIIAQVNKHLPRTFGDGIIHESHVDAMVQWDEPLHEMAIGELSPEEEKIGKLIADNLVEDGATLQMGIGAIPDAVLAQLGNHKNLGIHSEMFSDGVVDLCEKGAITNTEKTILTGKIASSFAVGSKRLYDFMDNNPFVEMCDVAFTNNSAVISQNPKVTAINSCIEVDLTGQICADSIGTKIYSGFGGQIDFIRGAAICLDGRGKPIIAMPSATRRGETKIVPTLKLGSGVVTTRAHVHYVVTEYGIAYLFGKSLRERAYELIQIAHPDHREFLEKAAFERLRCMPAPFK
ncbi:4-hydroxybutyrate coenzyme A transferase-like isoform X1 [Mercenaria mercenaria]|uniref:4-hydroxybutyrate coenzyme A transferase-like isoform X1 n=1 Tax=Mercenaria mercenaria TaxID=6596 RepID=UPI00234EB333|nr:4-hydroxybutyrate coenzyme A transferase-like isoform X1 [Mercenaria mercenaria]